ncbi:site-specific integrase [Ruegeria sp. HU-ET01832]|uniref:site-specific integrase n=1 Tax=Ruegeria sp. HU-ET01832 TaxID=3135906 RepID=UPI003104DFAD
MRTLEKMPGHPRLYRRGSTYYHRAAVPKDIADSYGKVEETFSLRTKNRAEALVRVRIEAARIDRLFEEHRRALSRQQEKDAEAPLDELTLIQIARAKQAYLHHLLDEDEEARLEGFEDPDDPDELIAYEPRPTFEEWQQVNQDMNEVNRTNLARGKRDKFFRSEAEEILTWEGIDLKLAEGSPSWPRLIRALQEASVEAHEATKDRDLGNPVSTPPYPEVTPRGTDGDSEGLLLSEAVTSWEAEKSRGAWSPKVRDDHLAWISAFKEIAGDKALSQYNKDDARRFKAVLLKLPANWKKKPEVRNLSILEAADKAAATGMPPMSSATLNKALRRVGAFWNWAEAHHDGIRTGLFKGLTIKETVNAREQRDPFSTEQLSKLFNSPLYTGCRSERFCAEPGDHSMRGTARYWLPLLGLFTGARLNELCQLKVSDVREEDGIVFLDITDEAEDQKVKSASGRRRIPVHRQLVELGFLEFVEERRDSGERQLFSELKIDASGYHSGEFSKFFSRYLERIGVKTEKTSFHSFRHNFEDACRNGGVLPHIMNAIQGHAELGMAGRYGDGVYRLGLLKDAIDNIQFAELDVSQI